MSTRRLIALVASCAVLMELGLHTAGRRPGFYLGPLGNLCVGVCRVDAAGRTLGPDGNRLGPVWETGVWRDEAEDARLKAGLRWQDGLLYSIVGNWRVVW